MMRRALLSTAAAIAAAAGWTASSSAILCAGLGKSDLFVFPYAQWFEAAPWWRNSWWLTAWIIASAAVPTAVPALCGFGLARHRWRNRSRRLVPPPGGGIRRIEQGVTDNHGHAAWATRKQIYRRCSGPGCLIGAMDRSPDAPLIFDDTDTGSGHSMIFAGPGSFKTTSAVTRIWHWRGPCVVFDPSCEIGPIMTAALREQGRTVITLGLNGRGFNALDWIDTANPECDAHIRTAVDHLYNEGATPGDGDRQGKDPFWSTWGKALITCLAAHMIHHPDPSGPKTLAALRQGIATPEADMPPLLTGIHKTSASRMARDLAGGLMSMRAAETFSSIYANSFAGTEYLSVGAYADIVSGDAMRTADILNRNTVVFVQLPLRTLLATPAIGRVVMGAHFNAMFHADGEGITDRILFEIDEAWVLGRLKEILLCHTTARKYRGCVQTLWQSEGQLEETWGRDGAKTMRDTVSWRSYNAVQDGDVAEKLSRDIGEHAVMAWSEGDNQGSHKPWGIALGSRSRGSNINRHEIKRRLIKPDEIMRAPADEMIVLARDFPQPIRAVSAPYFRYPEIAGRMKANRFFKQPIAAE